MSCNHCPVAIGLTCRGEEHAVFCGYLDPMSSSYKPAYARILTGDDVILTDAARERMLASAQKETAASGEPIVLSGCCGGNPYGDD